MLQAGHTLLEHKQSALYYRDMLGLPIIDLAKKRGMVEDTPGDLEHMLKKRKVLKEVSRFRGQINLLSFDVVPANDSDVEPDEEIHDVEPDEPPEPRDQLLDPPQSPQAEASDEEKPPDGKRAVVLETMRWGDFLFTHVQRTWTNKSGEPGCLRQHLVF